MKSKLFIGQMGKLRLGEWGRSNSRSHSPVCGPAPRESRVKRKKSGEFSAQKTGSGLGVSSLECCLRAPPLPGHLLFLLPRLQCHLLGTPDRPSTRSLHPQPPLLLTTAAVKGSFHPAPQTETSLPPSPWPQLMPGLGGARQTSAEWGRPPPEGTPSSFRCPNGHRGPRKEAEEGRGWLGSPPSQR